MLLAFFIFIYLFLVMSYVYTRRKHLALKREKNEFQIYRRRNRLFSDEPNPSLLTTTYTSQ